MSHLHEALDDYLSIRRSLGFKLLEPARLLHRFVSFMEEQDASHITTKLALQWAQEPTDAQPYIWSLRLGVVRRFAAWRCASDPRTEVPPEGLLPYRYRRKPPYIYTDDEINKIMQAASELRSSRGLRAPTYTTLFGLLAVTGMRSSEALNLDRSDVDLVDGILNIRCTKFGKSRIVPLHVSTQEAVKDYANTRERLLPCTMTPAFFVSERGTRIAGRRAHYTFAKLSQKIGLREYTKGHGRGPRLHDMRHRFAARTLVNWYRAGLDVEREIPKLATYLGHVNVNSTYWYLESVPELLQLATERIAGRKEARL
jgi:integrase